MEKLIKYFATKHILTNFIMLTVFICGIFMWHNIKREEMPDVTFDIVRITTVYPGATPEEVEYFVTVQIEEELQSISGIKKIISTSSFGRSSIRLELDNNPKERDEILNDIKDAVDRVKLPDEVEDDPIIRQFKTSQKAIIDIGIYNDKAERLSYKEREELQKTIDILEARLKSLPQINDISWNNYEDKEIQVLLKPEKMYYYNISFTQVMDVLKKNNIRMPIGEIDLLEEAKITIDAELTNVYDIENLIIQGGFEGNNVRLRAVADVKYATNENTSILKINGFEGVRGTVRKNSSYGILESVDIVKDTIKKFQKNNLKNSDIKLILIDDESSSVRNRLKIISNNAVVGFVLILLMLFLFMDFKSGCWVALGIPFTFCFTLIIAYLVGYTINNVTLAAVIIVMGMVVDDAIVIAENVSRMRTEGHDQLTASVQGTKAMIKPVIASILTTAVAFVPLYFFKGRFGMFVKYIPMIIFFMLGGSLFEAIVILPAHLNAGFNFGKAKKEIKHKSWFLRLENFYEKVLNHVLRHKFVLFLFFIALVVWAFFILKNDLKFVMFPNEETTQVRVNVEAKKETTKWKTAKLTKQLEDILLSYDEVLSVRTDIAKSRHGSQVEENKATLRIEIVEKSEREKSTKKLVSDWEKKFKENKNFKKIRFARSRFGQASGSSVEILVKENNDDIRERALNDLVAILGALPTLKNVEIDESLNYDEYKLTLNRDNIVRFSISPSSISRTLRAIAEGIKIYEFKDSDGEEVDVVVESHPDYKYKFADILKIPIENTRGHLINLASVVKYEKIKSPSNISRQDYKRATTIYADINEKSKTTPLEVADYLETNIFDDFYSKYPTVDLKFTGEILDSRESRQDFLVGILLVLFIIYAVLAILFDSLLQPFIIMFSIPFGVVGVILCLKFHGISTYGFFSVIGILGLAGVVVNDSIVMLVKLQKELDIKRKSLAELKQNIAAVSKTRLRAVLLTTITTVAGLFPTAYGLAGYDAMLSSMMLVMAWGLVFGTLITLFLVPSVYAFYVFVQVKMKASKNKNIPR